MYLYDANEILAAPLKSRSGSHKLEAYNKQVEHLTNTGYIPKVHGLYNEALTSLNKYNKQKYIEYQLVTKHIFTASMQKSEASGHGKITLLLYLKHGHPFTYASLVSNDITLHNDLKYADTFPEKPNYVGTHRNWEEVLIQQNTSWITWNKGDSTQKQSIEKNLRDTWSTGVVNWTIYGALIMLHMIQTQHQGGKTCRCGGIFATTLLHARITSYRVSHQGFQGTETHTKHPGPQTPLTIGESQLHAINRFEKIFNTMQP